MKNYDVTVARIENLVWVYQVSAKNKDHAKQLAMELHGNDESSGRCVHAEVFVNDIEEAQ